MTISILAYDEKSGTYGGAATTGSLCVGGWVLRGAPESGMSASQGSLPSTMWGSDVLDLMRSGVSAVQAVTIVADKDTGRDQRQLAALDMRGQTASFTGSESLPASGACEARHVIVSGNLLASSSVLDACLKGFLDSAAGFAARLLDALDSAAAAGGDSRGLQSAALLVVSAEMAPLTLRIDHSDQPLKDLRALYTLATQGSYAEWASKVPTVSDPHRSEPYRLAQQSHRLTRPFTPR